MPPDGYPALQYLQSVRVRKVEPTPDYGATIQRHFRTLNSFSPSGRRTNTVRHEI